MEYLGYFLFKGLQHQLNLKPLVMRMFLFLVRLVYKNCKWV